ncbi:restriction endonuclease subunit S [Blautia caecimuris]|uniref:restriction endonuclease subunit S n=1 Tax=Blautia caecimuris TaxID=1796615 RepID=UPI00399404CB
MKEPKLRFKADDGSDFPDWEEKKLGDMFSISAGGDIDKNNSSKEKSCSYPYPVYANALMNDGLYGYANYFKVDGDTFTVTGRGDVGYAVARHCKYVPIVRLLVCRPKENDNVDFFAEQVNCARIFIESTGVPQLTAPQLAVIKLLRPSLPEQQKIADFLSTIDTIIEKQRAMVSAWEERKKGVMQKLFSQEVRFKADDGSDFPDWEEKRLGDMVEFINGRAYKQDELLASGKYIVLRVGNLFTNDSYYYSDLELDEDKYIEDGNLIYAWSATFGPKIYHGDKCIYHYHIWKLKFDENAISKMFLNYYLQHDVEKIKSKRTGGTMVHITKNAMEHRELEFPSLSEQQKIADCLSALDTVIQKQKETLEKWQELKKGLLQQMFV